MADPRPTLKADDGHLHASRQALLSRLEDAFYLPSALARVAQYIVENPDKAVHLSLGELSARAQSGQASVVRLCRELGFSGFKAFKLALAADLALQQATRTNGGNLAPDPFDQASDLIARSIAQTRSLLDIGALGDIAGELHRATRINVFGSGVSGLVAEIFSYRLLRAGLNANTVRDIYILREVATELSSNSAAIAISQSGVSPETV